MAIFSKDYSGRQRISMPGRFRNHKGEAFFRVGPRYTTKRECRSFIRKNQLQNRYYYRIYGSRHHGYGIYRGPPKGHHGGIRKGRKRL